LVFQLGDDSFGQDFLGVLKSNQINTDYVNITNGVSSGMAQITVADNGERPYNTVFNKSSFSLFTVSHFSLALN
jgi:sugar/nucleoside kinase (ribokinase family)